MLSYLKNLLFFMIHDGIGYILKFNHNNNRDSKNNVNGVVFVSILLTIKIFHTFF